VASEGAELTESHRLEQLAIVAGFLREFVPLFTLLDWNRLDETSPAWVQAVMGLIRTWRQESADVASAYYDRYRELELPRSAAPGPELEFVSSPEARGATILTLPNRSSGPARNEPAHFGRREPARLVWDDRDKSALHSMVSTGPAHAKHLTKQGVDERRARPRVLVTVSGSAEKQVMTGARDAIMTKAEKDPRAVGWMRVTSGNPCAFCAMLASRGPVYFSESSAGFLPHDNCHCVPMPVFSRRTAWPGDNAAYARLWRSSTQGYSGQDAINAFRRAYERQQRDRQRLAETAIA
jgi:hypothetical protein